MNFLKKLLKPSSLLLLVIVSLISFSIAHAALIDDSNKTAQLFSDNANQVNFKPSFQDAGNPVYAQVSATEMTGYAWGNVISWVNLNSHNCDSNGDNLTDTGNFTFCSTGQPVATFKVARTGNTLSGYAFSENGGWINFGPFANSATPQVTINGSGEFNGFAWIQNYGWLEFACPGASCVKIAVAPTPGGGGGGGGGTPPVNGVCDPASNGQTFSTAPTELCSSGTPSPSSLSGPGPWTWDCLGQNGGFDNYPNNQQCHADYSPDAPPATCQDSAATNFGEPEACTYTLTPPDDGGACTPPQVYDTSSQSCVTPSCTGPNCTTPPPQPVCDPATNPNCPPPTCSGPNCTITPDGGCTGPDCVFPQPTCDPATDPNCSLTPPDEGCVGNDCGKPTCTGPNCTINDDGSCTGSDCTFTPGGDGDNGGTGGGGPGGLVEGVLNSILPPEVVDQISGTLNDPTVSAVTKVVTTAGLILGAGAAAMAALFASPILLGDIALVPFKLWTLLLSFLGIRKKSPPWGTVFDSITMQPLDPAYIVLKDAQGKDVATSITDVDGRYGFPVEPGTYKIFANKSDYQFPSAKLAGKTSTSLYKDLYFGEDIIVKQAGEILTKNIPMDRLNFNWNEFEKEQKNLMKFYKHRNKLIAEISSFFFGVGFTVATIALIFAPQGYNIGIFALYVLLFVLRNTNILKAKKTGSVTRADGTPLSFAIMRVYPAAIPDVEISHRVTDKFGNFYALVPNGNYIVKFDQKIGDDSYQTVFVSEPVKVSKGLIDTKFTLK